MIYFEKRGDQLIPAQAKVKGAKYLDDKEARTHARKNNIGAVEAADGSVIAKSIHFLTTAEKKAIGEQKILRGPHAGKQLSAVPELLAITLDPDVYPI